MWKKNKFFILVAIGLIAIGFIESLSPKETLWIESYSKIDKIPYGDYVLFEELKSLFTKEIMVSNESLSRSLTDSVYDDFIMINSVFEPAKEDVDALLDFVAGGNHAMIISRHVSDYLLDTLGLSTELSLSNFSDTLSLSLVGDSSRFFGATYNIHVGAYFDDMNDATVLGHVSDSLPNFIGLNYGDGQLFIHLLPSAFTNVYILNENNHEYVSSALSYLPDQRLIWDEYYKARKDVVVQSPFKEVLNTPGLLQALYLSLFGTLIYIVFASKRKQRAIPVLVPKTNSTVEFIETMGQLYYNESNHKEIGQKRVQYFFSHVRNRYKLDTTVLDESFVHKLSALSGVLEEDIERLINNFKVIQAVDEVLDERLIEQERLIENYYKKERYNGE